MAITLADSVKETTAVTGTGTLTLLGAATGYQAFSSASPSLNGLIVAIRIEAIAANGALTGDWEVVEGVFSSGGNTITRVTVRASSNGGALVSFAAGTKNVFLICDAVNFPLNVVEANVRLTGTSGSPVAGVTSNLLALTTVFATPYKGYVLPIYNGATWQVVPFAELSIKLTDTQNGTTTNGSAVVTGLTSTAQFMRGMGVTGTGIPALSTISSIDSATQVTLNNNATTSATNSLAFKIPVSKNVDIFAVLVSGAVALRFGNFWTSDTARSDALTALNGIQVNNAAINAADSNTIAANKGTLLGTVRTTTTAGQTEDSGGSAISGSNTSCRRFIWNNYNRIAKPVSARDVSTPSWTYNNSAFRASNNNSALIVEVLQGLVEEKIFLEAMCTDGDNALVMGIGEDSLTVNSCTVNSLADPSATTVLVNPFAVMNKTPALGYHYYSWLEAAANSSLATQYNFGTYRQSGMIGEWMC